MKLTVTDFNMAQKVCVETIEAKGSYLPPELLGDIFAHLHPPEFHPSPPTRISPIATLRNPTYFTSRCPRNPLLTFQNALTLPIVPISNFMRQFPGDLPYHSPNGGFAAGLMAFCARSFQNHPNNLPHDPPQHEPLRSSCALPTAPYSPRTAPAF